MLVDPKHYQGAGRAWVAIKNNEIVGVRYMNNYPYTTPGSEEALKRAGKTRVCESSRRAAEQINTKSFLLHRAESKRELSKLGDVVSGMMSAGSFLPGF